jgi:hypothetical protein
MYYIAARMPSGDFITTGWKDFRGHKILYDVVDVGDTGSDNPHRKPGPFKHALHILRKAEDGEGKDDWKLDYSPEREVRAVKFENATNNPVEIWVRRRSTMAYDAPPFKAKPNSEINLVGYPPGRYQFAVKLPSGKFEYSGWKDCVSYTVNNVRFREADGKFIFDVDFRIKF